MPFNLKHFLVRQHSQRSAKFASQTPTKNPPNQDPDFTSWFANSQVTVDGKPGSQPLLLWRGDKTKGIQTYNHDITWFTTNKAYASAVGYNGEVRAFYLKATNLLDATEDGNLNVVYNWAETFHHPDHDHETMANAVLTGDLFTTGGHKAQLSLINYAKQQGFDGVKWLENSDQGINYVVFSPNQIRLASPQPFVWTVCASMNLQIKQLSATTWDAYNDRYDFHIRLEQDEWMIDAFDIFNPNPNEAYLDSSRGEANTLQEAMELCQQFNGSFTQRPN